MLRLTPVLLCFAWVVFAGSVPPAAAEIVYFTSGRTFSVKAHAFEGESVVLTLRSGGRVTCDRSQIARIVPDEFPRDEAAAAQPSQDDAATRSTRLRETPYDEIIAALSRAHGVDPLLVQALIQVESNYRPRARSPKGAMGLMQLMPATAREYRVRNPFEPRANIEAGIKHLKSLIDRFGVEVGLAAYNAGEGAVRKFNGFPPYRETRNYVSKILSLAGLK
jgi:soluble lytic murein transglycosylase-like protein